MIEDFSRYYGFVARTCQPYRPCASGRKRRRQPPPRWDLAYQPLGTVAVRDLAFYERVAAVQGGLAS